MLKKDMVKRIRELQEEKREIVESFFESLRLINKNNMKMEISPAVREFCAYDIRVAKSKKPIEWKFYGGTRFYERLDKMGFPPEIFIKALKILIRNVKKYEKDKKSRTVIY